MKMPKVLNYFPPKTVKCIDCGYVNAEAKFIREQQQRSTLLNYSH
jgi:hypothetical protein